VSALARLAAAALADAKPTVFWQDPQVAGHTVPEPEPELRGHITTDLAVVGGGYSGLWDCAARQRTRP